MVGADSFPAVRQSPGFILLRLPESPQAPPEAPEAPPERAPQQAANGCADSARAARAWTATFCIPKAAASTGEEEEEEASLALRNCVAHARLPMPLMSARLSRK
jgi:hypothetical protein